MVEARSPTRSFGTLTGILAWAQRNIDASRNLEENPLAHNAVELLEDEHHADSLESVRQRCFNTCCPQQCTPQGR